MASETDIALSTIAPLIDRVKFLTQQSEYDNALRFLGKAIEKLTLLLAELEGRSDPPSETLQQARNRVAHQLADCYGRQGGILRRQERWDEAIASYQSGCDLEQNPKYEIVDSYNLTNALVLSLIAHPERLRELQPALEDARRLVELQVQCPPRRTQWWAWADLGLLSLLSGKQEEAHGAYQNVERNGAQKAHFESIVGVLRQCQERLEPTDPMLAATLSASTDALDALMITS
jgi:tetratricopeptide (TPR) repeat protein